VSTIYTVSSVETRCSRLHGDARVSTWFRFGPSEGGFGTSEGEFSTSEGGFIPRAGQFCALQTDAVRRQIWITPNKRSAVRGKLSQLSELRSSSTPYGVVEERRFTPCCALLARGYQNWTPAASKRREVFLHFYLTILARAQYSTSEGEFSTSEGGFGTSEGGFSTSEGGFSTSEGGFGTSEGGFSTSGEGTGFIGLFKSNSVYVINNCYLCPGKIMIR
jgi:hypothetical protein